MFKLLLLFFRIITCRQCFLPAALLLLSPHFLFPRSATSEKNPGYSVCNEIADRHTSKAQILFNNGNYSEAITFFHKAGFIYKRTKNWNAYITGVVDIACCYRLLADFHNSKKFLAVADSVASLKFKEGDIIFASVNNAKACLYYSLGDYNLSLSHAQKALALRSKINGKNDTLLYYVYYMLGADYFCLNELKKSQTCFNKALQLSLSRKHPLNSETANVLESTGQIYWKSGSCDTALKYYRNALSVYSRTPDVNNFFRASVYNNMSSYFSKAGNYKYALKLLNNAESLLSATDKNNSSLLASVYSNKAYIFSSQNDYENAIIYAGKILQFESEANPRFSSYAYFIIGESYFALNKFSQAVTYFNKCCQLNSNAASTNPDVLLYLAKSYQKNNQIQKSDSAFSAAYKIISEKFPGNTYSLIDVLINYGEFCLDNNRKAQALFLFDKAYKASLKKFGLKNINTAVCLNKLGDYHLADSAFSDALKFYHLALTAQIKNFNSAGIFSNPVPNSFSPDIYLLNSFKGKAFSLLCKYKSGKGDIIDLKTALTSYEFAAEIIGQLRTGFNNSESAIALSDKEKSTFDQAVSTAVLLYSITDSAKYYNLAFSFAEKSKAAFLLSVIRNSSALCFGNVPVVIQNLDNDLQEKIYRYKFLISEESKADEPDYKKIIYWNNCLLKFKNQHRLLVIYLGKYFPGYYNIKYNISVINPDSVSERLGSNDALIEYVQTPSAVFSFLITKNIRKVFITPPDSSFYYSSRNYLQCLTTGINGANNCGKFINSASSLYKYLIAPFQNLIKNKNLIIIPDESLCSIPFESLLSHYVNPSSAGYRSLPYLIFNNAVSYAVSATLLFDKPDTVFPALNNLAAFAPSYNYSSSSQVISSPGSPSFSLCPLPAAETEVNNICKIIPGKIFSGKDATAGNFIKNSSGYNILHLAMHTVFNNENPLYSSLAFEPSDSSNGLFNASDLFKLKLNARMIALSSCKSGAGDVIKGEGIFCIARAFMYAGCPSLVLSLWNVNDIAGSQLMSAYYHFIAAGFSKNDAMRFAKIYYIRNATDIDAAPCYWAGYINYGSNSPLFKVKESSSALQTFLFLIFPLFACAGMVFYFRKYIFFFFRLILGKI